MRCPRASRRCASNLQPADVVARLQLSLAARDDDERILFERLARSLGSGEVAVQRLLEPHLLALAPTEGMRLARLVDALAPLGFLLEPLSGQESHMIARAAHANALVLVPRGEGELAAGAAVSWLPF